MSRRSGAGDKKVSQRNWGSFDIYVRTYTRLHTPGTVLTYTFVGIHTTQMYTAWTVLTYTQLADFGSGGDGRGQDKGQSHRAALATMHYFVDIVICSVSFLLLFFGCFVFSILWVYVNRTKM